MNTYVSFEIAKLLKEKEFDKRTPMVWLDSLGKQHLREMHISLLLNNAEYNAPTIAEVVMWIYEKHGIWVEVNLPLYKGFGYTILKIIYNTTFLHKISDEEFETPTEAYTAAINYCLTKLI